MTIDPKVAMFEEWAKYAHLDLTRHNGDQSCPYISKETAWAWIGYQHGRMDERREQSK